MQIVVIKPEKLYKYEFPTDNVSTYWIQDLDNNSTKRDLISIKKVETSWILEYIKGTTGKDCCWEKCHKRLDL